MANRTPMMDRSLPRSGVTPQVRYATTAPVAGNAGQAAFTIGETLRGIAVRFEDRLDIQAQADAAREGAVAGQQDGLPALQDEATIRGRAFNASARDATITRLDLQGRLHLSELEQKNQTDPVKFREEAQSYLKGTAQALQGFDPALAQRYAAEYELRMDAADKRVMARQREVLRDQQLEQALRYQLAAQDEIAGLAAGLFTGAPEDVQLNMAQMIGSAGRMVDVANQIGPDGQPLFSARERISFERQAEQAVSEQVGLAWMRAQPDMLAAFDDWRSGRAEVELAGDDGSAVRLNVRDMLGPRGYQMAEKAFFDNLKSDLALQSQIHTASERAFKQSSDALFSDLSVMGQQGQLNLNAVEAARSGLEPDRYLALREIAVGGFATVSDGAALTRLMEQDADGIDITADLRAAKGQLTQSDFTRLYDRNIARVGEAVKNPVQSGRDYLVKGIGGLASTLGPEQSAQIGFADAEYDIEIERFVAEKGRQPGYQESRDIAEAVRARYSQAKIEEVIQFLPLPQTISNAERGSLTAEDVQQRMIKAQEMFLDVHGGDAQRRADDPAYRREMLLLKQYYDALMADKERRDAGGRTRR